MEGLLPGSLFLAWLEHDEMAVKCGDLDVDRGLNVEDEDSESDQSLLSGDEVGTTLKSNATVSVSKKQTNN